MGTLSQNISQKVLEFSPRPPPPVISDLQVDMAGPVTTY